MPRLSGIILTRDNEHTIERAARSLVGLVDELIVVDDGSEDETLDIVLSVYPSAKILHRKLDRFDAQRNFGIEHATGEWVLMIDSDEEVSPELAKLIKEEIKNPRREIYTCFIVNEALGRVTKIRLERPLLFRREARFQTALHETISGDKGFLPGELWHHSWVDMEDWMRDINRYSTYQAKKWLLARRNYSLFQLALIALFMPPFHFLKLVVGQGRWRNGFFAGFVYPLAQAAEWLFVVLKYYEMRFLNKRDNSEPLDGIS